MEKLTGLGNDRKFLELVDAYSEAIKILEKQKKTSQEGFDSLSSEEEVKLKELFSKISITSGNTTTAEDLSRYGESFSPEQHRRLQSFDAKIRKLME